MLKTSKSGNKSMFRTNSRGSKQKITKTPKLLKHESSPDEPPVRVKSSSCLTCLSFKIQTIIRAVAIQFVLSLTQNQCGLGPSANTWDSFVMPTERSKWTFYKKGTAMILVSNFKSYKFKTQFSFWLDFQLTMEIPDILYTYLEILKVLGGAYSCKSFHKLLPWSYA